MTMHSSSGNNSDAFAFLPPSEDISAPKATPVSLASSQARELTYCSDILAMDQLLSESAVFDSVSGGDQPVDLSALDSISLFPLSEFQNVDNSSLNSSATMSSCRFVDLSAATCSPPPWACENNNNQCTKKSGDLVIELDGRVSTDGQPESRIKFENNGQCQLHHHHHHHQHHPHQQQQHMLDNDESNQQTGKKLIKSLNSAGSTASRLRTRDNDEKKISLGIKKKEMEFSSTLMANNNNFGNLDQQQYSMEQGFYRNNNNNEHGKIHKIIQNLNPVFPSDQRDLQNGHWFRCQLCHAVLETQRLFYHAKEVHNLRDMSAATAHCISPCQQQQFLQQQNQFLQQQQQPDLLVPGGGGHLLLHQHPHPQLQAHPDQMPFSSQSHKDWTLAQSPQQPHSIRVTTSFDHNDPMAASGAGTHPHFLMAGPTIPSGHLINEDTDFHRHHHHHHHPPPPQQQPPPPAAPQQHHHHHHQNSDDTEDKFIDSLMRAMPPTTTTSSSGTASSSRSTTLTTMANTAAATSAASLTTLSLKSVRQIQPHHLHQSANKKGAAAHQQNNNRQSIITPLGGRSAFNFPATSGAVTKRATVSAPKAGSTTASVRPNEGSARNNGGSAANTSGGKTPQFRWRRRKRRSKAQYPEMSRYLLPIDDGDEIQHLGRTLECQLCGLRGKRCHLTLHFKAKHSEVIDLEHRPIRNSSSKGGQSNNAKAKQTNNNNKQMNDQSSEPSGKSKKPLGQLQAASSLPAHQQPHQAKPAQPLPTSSYPAASFSPIVSSSSASSSDLVTPPMVNSSENSNQALTTTAKSFPNQSLAPPLSKPQTSQSSSSATKSFPPTSSDKIAHPESSDKVKSSFVEVKKEPDEEDEMEMDQNNDDDDLMKINKSEDQGSPNDDDDDESQGESLFCFRPDLALMKVDLTDKLSHELEDMLDRTCKDFEMIFDHKRSNEWIQSDTLQSQPPPHEMHMQTFVSMKYDCKYSIVQDTTGFDSPSSEKILPDSSSRVPSAAASSTAKIMMVQDPNHDQSGNARLQPNGASSATTEDGGSMIVLGFSQF